MDHVLIPFTLTEYERSDGAERIALLKMMVDKLKQTEPFTWAELRAKFDKTPGVLHACEHEFKMWVTALCYERQLAAMRESMENLCEEMERVKKEQRVFHMGPGTESINAET